MDSPILMGSNFVKSKEELWIVFSSFGAMSSIKIEPLGNPCLVGKVIFSLYCSRFIMLIWTYFYLFIYVFNV